MKTASLSRTLPWAVSALLIGACSSSPSEMDTSQKIEPTHPSNAPSLPALGNLDYRAGPGPQTRQALPPDIESIIASLPASDLSLPAIDLPMLLNQSRAFVLEIPRISERPDRLVSARALPGAEFWVRSFESENPDVTGYLVQLRIDCRLLTNVPSETWLTLARTQCVNNERSGFDSGLRAYRKTRNQPIEDLTGTIVRPEEALGTKVLRRYATATASLPFPDSTRIDRVPVIRWIVESDPDNPLSKDAHTFGNGSFAHAGFLLWNGERFETRITVPTALWPCIDKTPQHDSWACPKDDRFVTPD
ncbi:MAG TPA: hypothetical protein DCY59_03655 [Micrococcaceae bacterium]|nr:hypothetical protein [Micrococcaceae bacterium]